MIDVYFMLKGKGECVGGISLREKHPTMGMYIWETYKVYPITEKTVLFRKTDNEFCTANGTYQHEMGKISIRYINDEWININVKETK